MGESNIKIKNRIFKKHIIAIILALSFLLFFHANFAFALNLGDAFKVKDGKDTDLLDAAAENAGYKIGGITLEVVIATALTAVLSLLGVVFLMLMVYGGYLWMTARGNEQDVEKAKGLITSAIIGLIIVIGAYAISWFVISNLVGTTLK